MTTRVDPEMQSLAALFRTAAAMLSGEGNDEASRGLLARLDYLNDATDATPNRIALLQAAARFHRLFTLEAPYAPGLVVLGAEVDPSCVGAPDMPLGSVSGTGLTFRQAFESCVGEGVEYLSQCATPDCRLELLTDAAALDSATPALRALWHMLQPYRHDRDAPLSAWTVGADLADGRPVRLPADLCYRRPPAARDFDIPWPLSTGCGAGPDPLSATLHGLLELIERDAVALWWRGGMRARLVAGDAGATLLACLRGDVTQRRSWLLDVTSDVGVPVVVAASCNNDGFGLCCGFAARPTLAEAAEAAVMEMAQMELAYRLTETKRTVRGDDALNEVDQQHVRRFTMVNVRKTPALQPAAPPPPPRDLPSADKLATLAAIRQRLAAVGLAPIALNLTRATFDIPVVRTICPGLEPGMTSPPGPRLRAAADTSGIDPAGVVPL